jgi:hypothetical protein
MARTPDASAAEASLAAIITSISANDETMKGSRAGVEGWILVPLRCLATSTVRFRASGMSCAGSRPP